MNLQIPQGSKVVELGGGANPMLAPRCLGGDCINVDVREAKLPDGRRCVDIVASFEEPLPLTTGEFDHVLSRFCIEHVSFPKTKQFVAEIFRILKPGGKATIISPNTQAQIRWIERNPDGWDGKDFFIAASEKLFGSQDYPDNSHKSFWNPDVATELFAQAGFQDILTAPFGSRGTDLLIEAKKPSEDKAQETPTNPQKPVQDATKEEKRPLPRLPEFDTSEGRASVFSKKYFDGGNPKHGWCGYGDGYRDYPCHEATLQHVLLRQPKSVLELGCGRGYVIKRLQDAGIPARGFDVSRHCQLTRVCAAIHQHDLCLTPWPASSFDGSWPKDVLNTLIHAGSEPFDLCLSVAFWEHVPEELVPAAAAEMRRCCKRGLHGIDLSESSDDPSKATLRPRAWWKTMLGEGHEVVEKNQLEHGGIPPAVLQGDGKVKWNLCSFTTMFHHGWVNCDVHDLGQFADGNKYSYRKIDVREGLPLMTGTTDFFMIHHGLEHFTPDEALTLCREMRRCVKPDGGLRIVVPDAEVLSRLYAEKRLGDFDELNDGVELAETQGGKFWQLLGEGHRASYDAQALCRLLENAGWEPHVQAFRQSLFPQILRETVEHEYGGYSLFVDAKPKLG